MKCYYYVLFLNFSCFRRWLSLCWLFLAFDFILLYLAGGVGLCWFVIWYRACDIYLCRWSVSVLLVIYYWICLVSFFFFPPGVRMSSLTFDLIAFRSFFR